MVPTVSTVHISTVPKVPFIFYYIMDMLVICVSCLLLKSEFTVIGHARLMHICLMALL